MPNLSRNFIESQVQSPDRGECFYHDSDLQGFCLRVTPHHRFYLVRCQFFGVKRTITIGSYSSMNPDEAREIASRILAAASMATIGETDIRLDRISITLGQAFEKYLSVRSLRPRTIKIYREMVTRCLGDWEETPVTHITKNMVQTRHRELCHTTKFGTEGKGQANLAMKLLRAILNFAADYYENSDGKPLLTNNPVHRLSQNKAWYQLDARQRTIPDHKLAAWYRAVMSLENRTLSDYMLFLLLTGLRRTEAVTLRWIDINFEDRIIVISGKVTKNHHEHRLPMSLFIEQLLLRRFAERKDTDYVFPGKGRTGHAVFFKYSIETVRAKSNCQFTLHDLRRTFLTMAEHLEVPHYSLKKLANHCSIQDITSGYVVIDMERLRSHMSRITERFLALLCPGA